MPAWWWWAFHQAAVAAFLVGGAVAYGFARLLPADIPLQLLPARAVITLAGVVLAALAGSACGLIYRQDVNQGNLVEQESVDLLKPGMTKRQVALIMGTPSIESPFDQDRWDYASSFSRRDILPLDDS